MKPIRSFYAICRRSELNSSQTATLQALLTQRKGVLHPYWIQLALYVPYDYAKRLYGELIVNEWAVPDGVEVNGISYESELTDAEIEIIAHIELSHNDNFIINNF